MRELEFLPTWYHQNRRCKRIVRFQIWVLLILFAGLGTWTILTQRNIHSAEARLGSIESQLTRTRADQEILAEKLVLRQQLQAQEELLASLGYPVEMSRLLQTLDTLMPREMSLIEFECSTDETARPVASVAAVRNSTEKKPTQYDRKLKVRLLGVAPSNSDLATFVSGLANVPVLEQVDLKLSKDIFDSGHVMREFTITFCMNLNQ